MGNLKLFHIAESLWDCVHQDGSFAAMVGGVSMEKKVVEVDTMIDDGWLRDFRSEV